MSLRVGTNLKRGVLLKNFVNSVFVGNVVSVSFAFLKKKPLSKVKYGFKIRKKYFWSIMFFSGLCIKYTKRSNFVILKNYSGLTGFTLKCFLNAPNVLGVFIYEKKLIFNKKSLLFTTVNNKKILKRLKFIS